MKNIEVTYDALICENGTYEQGEAAFILPMTDELAAEYLAGRATDRGAVNLVETALEAVEVMTWATPCCWCLKRPTSAKSSA